MCAAANLQPLVRSIPIVEWRPLITHCHRCGRNGHSSQNCWAQFHKLGIKLIVSDDESDADSLKSEDLGSEDSTDSDVMGIHIPMVHEAVERKIKEKSEYMKRLDFKNKVKIVAIARRLKEYGVDHWINNK
jgi:hypothetical protein